MPVLDIGWNSDDHTRSKADGFLSLLLIPAFSSGANQQLAAPAVGVMNMPVVPAARFKGHIGQKHSAFARFGQRIQIGIVNKILGVCRVGIAKAKNIFFIKRSFIVDTHEKTLLHKNFDME